VKIYRSTYSFIDFFVPLCKEILKVSPCWDFSLDIKCDTIIRLYNIVYYNSVSLHTGWELLLHFNKFKSPAILSLLNLFQWNLWYNLQTYNQISSQWMTVVITHSASNIKESERRVSFQDILLYLKVYSVIYCSISMPLLSSLSKFLWISTLKSLWYF
jgi:hypothetical protein